MKQCPLCGEESFRSYYQGPIRSGVASQYTSEDHEVEICNECGLVRLADAGLTLEAYSSDVYRERFNGDTSLDAYFETHDAQESSRLSRIAANDIRNKTLLDFGCGGGSFLDRTLGMTKESIGIDPNSRYVKALRGREIIVFEDTESALRKYGSRIDTLTSFCVIEHIVDPLIYLKQAHDLLRPGGVMYLETDNLRTLLMTMDYQPFEKFFFRTAHTYYFDQHTLAQLAKKAGFEAISISFRQVYDLSNLVLWLRDGKPTGNKQLKVFDNRLNSAYTDYLEESGYADRIFLKMSKNSK
jgi:2-polyprenyl-3-methyl-5-hydroxy-6-metoxy-1,4-benzoquinol methylase